MADFFEYVFWRGDVEFSSSEFNPVDALIFSQVSYMNFDGLIPCGYDRSITVKELFSRFKKSPDFAKRKNIGVVINPKTNDLFEKIADSNRFGKVKLCGWKNRYSEKTEEQFLAFTAFIEDFALIVFRGTDDTIVGWKEDFNLAFREEIEAQKDALEYVNSFIEKNPNVEVKIAGHSKGGNLAIYSAAKAKKTRQISEVYNFDGPGFSKEDLESRRFKKIQPKVKSFYPECSIIGMLFNHFPEYKIVGSTEKLLMQHDAMSWKIHPTSFEEVKSFDRKSRFIEKTFNSWYMGLSADQRTQFVETIFDALFASSAKNFTEFTQNWEKSFQAILKTAWEQDFEMRKSNLKIIGQLLDEARKNLDEAMHSDYGSKDRTEH